MATYTRSFGMGKGVLFDVVGYLYNGNEFVLLGDVLVEYEKLYVGVEVEVVCAAAEAYVIKSSDLKKFNVEVKNVLSVCGLFKICVVWGIVDCYFDDVLIYDWCVDICVFFFVMRKVGYCSYEDFVVEVVARC